MAVINQRVFAFGDSPVDILKSLDTISIYSSCKNDPSETVINKDSLPSNRMPPETLSGRKEYPTNIIQIPFGCYGIKSIILEFIVFDINTCMTTNDSGNIEYDFSYLKKLDYEFSYIMYFYDGSLCRLPQEDVDFVTTLIRTFRKDILYNFILCQYNSHKMINNDIKLKKEPTITYEKLLRKYKNQDCSDEDADKKARTELELTIEDFSDNIETYIKKYEDDFKDKNFAETFKVQIINCLKEIDKYYPDEDVSTSYVIERMYKINIGQISIIDDTIVVSSIPSLPPQKEEIINKYLPEKYMKNDWIKEFIEIMIRPVRTTFNFMKTSRKIFEENKQKKKMIEEFALMRRAIEMTIEQKKDCKEWTSLFTPVFSFLNEIVQFSSHQIFAALAFSEIGKRLGCYVGNQMGYTTTNENGEDTCYTSDNIGKGYNSACQIFLGNSLVKSLCSVFVPDKESSKMTEFLTRYEANLKMLQLSEKFNLKYNKKTQTWSLSTEKKT